MINLNDVYLDYANAIAADDAIKTWCQTNYGSDHTVYMGWDDRDMPDQDDCPVVGILPATQRRNRSTTAAVDISFGVFVCIYDSSTVTGTHDNIVEFSGVRNVEDLRKLVQTAIIAVDIGNADITSVDAEYEPVILFPLYEASFTITMREMAVIGPGADPFA